MAISLSQYADQLYPAQAESAEVQGVDNAWRGKDYGYGQRPDGTYKAPGFLGELKRPDGNVSTEISVGYNINGKEMDIPLIVPTLNKTELDYLLNTDPGDKDFFKNMPKGLEDKAIEHAQERIKAGKSPFFGQEDEQ